MTTVLHSSAYPKLPAQTVLKAMCCWTSTSCCLGKPLSMPATDKDGYTTSNCPYYANHGYRGTIRTTCAQRMHRVRYLNNFSRKWSTFEALVNTIPWWKMLGEESWPGAWAPMGELTCNQCSHRLKEDK